MASDSTVNIFTQKMKQQFITQFEAVADPLPYQRFTEIIPSETKVEHYGYFRPAPGVHEFKGHRYFTEIPTKRYSVENKTWSNEFIVPMDDLDDDQTSGYALKSKELAEKMREWPARRVMQVLAAGSSTPCFDGSNFFADSHNEGVGDNNVPGVAAGSDGVAGKLVALYSGGALKPMIWQMREGPHLETDSGQPASKEARAIKFWADSRGEAAYGYWWHAILVSFTNTPTVTELHTAFGTIETTFRGFALPKVLGSEDSEYYYEQRDFNQSNLTIVGSAQYSELLRQALAQDWVPQQFSSTVVVPTTNRFKGWASWLVSKYL